MTYTRRVLLPQQSAILASLQPGAGLHPGFCHRMIAMEQEQLEDRPDDTCIDCDESDATDDVAVLSNTDIDNQLRLMRGMFFDAFEDALGTIAVSVSKALCHAIRRQFKDITTLNAPPPSRGPHPAIFAMMLVVDQPRVREAGEHWASLQLLATQEAMVPMEVVTVPNAGLFGDKTAFVVQQYLEHRCSLDVIVEDGGLYFGGCGDPVWRIEKHPYFRPQTPPPPWITIDHTRRARDIPGYMHKPNWLLIIRHELGSHEFYGWLQHPHP